MTDVIEQPSGDARRRWSRYTSTFVPVPAGPGMRDRLRAALGALIAIGLTGVLCGVVAGTGLAHPLLVAPMGASAVLLFALPASPLAQPWSVLAGNIVSAFVGLFIAHVVPHLAWASALAVGGAIVAMSMLRCLHPPGGAVALSCVLGSAGHAAYPCSFALMPVGLNTVLMVVAAVIFHRFSGHSYPHRPIEAPAIPLAPPGHRPLTLLDIEAALADYGEALDVAPEDLLALFQSAEKRTGMMVALYPHKT